MRHILSVAAIVALASPSLAQISEGFEAYPDGGLAGHGGWETWYSGGNDGNVVSGGAHGGSKSMQMVNGTDAVHRFTISGGQWDCSVWTFIPSGSLDAYFIMMNQYGDVSIDNWSVQIRLNGDSSDPAGSVIESQFDLSTLPAILDAWVELRVEIDLDGDVVNSFYNGQPLGVSLSWSNNVSANGTPTIACIDLYSATSDGCRWDDLSLQSAGEPCVGDLDGNGFVELQDLAILLAHFGTPSGGLPENGDLDGDGDIELQDLAILLARFGTTC